MQHEVADPRQAWLDSLKPGDKVVVEYSRYGTTNESIGLVEAIKTVRKKRLIALRGNGMEFNSTGVENKKRGAWDTLCEIQPLTDERRERIERRRLIARIRAAAEKREHLEGFETKYLRQIYALIGEK